MDVEIIKKDGTSFHLSDCGVVVQDFIVHSIPLNSIYSDVEGRNGRIDYGASYGNRNITVPFTAVANDLHDFPLLRDELFGLVVSCESFYIRELRRPKYQAYKFVDVNEKPQVDETTNDQYVGGKRYLVRISDSFELDQSSIYGESELVFETTELPYAESIGTTADITGNRLKYSDELWSYGMGLLYDEESHKYIHATKQFRIYNAGNVEVHPFEQYLKINIPTIFSSENYFELINKTTGDIFRVNEGMNTRSIEIDGPNVKIDGLQALRKTNRQFISLAPGWNEFEVKGAGSARVEFDFRYYYK